MDEPEGVQGFVGSGCLLDLFEQAQTGGGPIPPGLIPPVKMKTELSQAQTLTLPFSDVGLLSATLPIHLYVYRVVSPGEKITNIPLGVMIKLWKPTLVLLPSPQPSLTHALTDIISCSMLLAFLSSGPQDTKSTWSYTWSPPSPFSGCFLRVEIPAGLPLLILAGGRARRPRVDRADPQRAFLLFTQLQKPLECLVLEKRTRRVNTSLLFSPLTCHGARQGTQDGFRSSQQKQSPGSPCASGGNEIRRGFLPDLQSMVCINSQTPSQGIWDALAQHELPICPKTCSLCRSGQERHVLGASWCSHKVIRFVSEDELPLKELANGVS